jgi:serine-type D-Ala-D-Ala carboxypeptidase/endopeptidase
MILVLPLLLLSLIGISQKSFSEKMRKQIDKTIAFETTIDYELTPGFIVGIVDSGHSIILSFGKKAVASEDTISADDIFELGSVTKVFTASLIAEMDKSGQLSLNDRFDTLLPEIYRNPEMSEFTVQDLLIHQAALPRFPPFAGEIASPLESLADYTLDNLLTFYTHFIPDKQEGMLYSNVSYALVEPILYNQTGMRYEELIEKFLLMKTSLTSTSFESETVTAPGYNLAGEPVPPVNFGVFNAAAGLKSNMTDMLRFVRYSLFDSPDILWLEHGTGMGKYLGMGLGWHIIHEGKFSPIFIHTGRSKGHTAFIGLVPETKTGVVILTNSANGVDDLGLEILRMINKNWKRKN